MPKKCKPMLATLVERPFDSKEWVYEIKFDGFRLLARIESGKVKLYSRNGIDVTARYPVICKALAGMKHSAIIDGELVALDPEGRSRFQLLQQALERPAHLQYCVFDILYLGSKDLRRLPLLERKALLKKILPKNKKIVYSTHIATKGTAFFHAAKKKGLEGVIAKRAAGRYYSGQRTREWLKFKAVMEQEVVIVGYTPPQNSRKYFGSLALAVHQPGRGGRGAWIYAGHVGTGFDEATLRNIYKKMRPLVTKRKPFTQKTKYDSATIWLTPKLVGEIKFTEWTSDGQMRHPAFLGLRTDKKATEVIREKAK